MKKQRCFLALLPQQELHLQLFDIVRQLQLTCAHMPLRWTRPEQYHLTMQFLGNLSEDQIEKLDTRLREQAAASLQEVKADVSIVSLFPNPQFPRVLAAMVEPNESLLQLHRHCRLPEQKVSARFAPHITLAYCKSAKFNWDFSPLPLASDLVAGELYLIASDLTDKGPIYNELGVYPLTTNPR